MLRILEQRELGLVSVKLVGQLLIKSAFGQQAECQTSSTSQEQQVFEPESSGMSRDKVKFRLFRPKPDQQLDHGGSRQDFWPQFMLDSEVPGE